MSYQNESNCNSEEEEAEYEDSVEQSNTQPSQYATIEEVEGAMSANIIEPNQPSDSIDHGYGPLNVLVTSVTRNQGQPNAMIFRMCWLLALLVTLNLIMTLALVTINSLSNGGQNGLIADIATAGNNAQQDRGHLQLSEAQNLPLPDLPNVYYSVGVHRQPDGMQRFGYRLPPDLPPDTTDSVQIHRQRAGGLPQGSPDPHDSVLCVKCTGRRAVLQLLPCRHKLCRMCCRDISVMCPYCQGRFRHFRPI